MFFRLLLLFVLELSCLDVMGQTRRALVIGIGVQQDERWGKINGDMDVPIVIDMLRKSGYQKRNILSLVNQQATKSKIMDAFTSLIKSCRPNDIVYIHFSGHGQRVTDIDGDEEDGWDESWIPYDAYRDYCIQDRGDKHLIDDEIYQLLFEIKGKIGSNGKILVVADACHSGGSSYSYMSYLLKEESLKSEMFFKDVVIRGISTPFRIPYKCVSKKTKKPVQWLMLSACKSFEFNQELRKPCVGILSYALYLTSRRGKVEMRKIEEFISKNKGPYPQTPILVGETEKYNISDVLK